jgi:hypothetical protein
VSWRKLIYDLGLQMQRPQSINWDFYREKLGPGIVNIFENSINCEPRTIASTACSISSFFTPGATVFRNVYIDTNSRIFHALRVPFMVNNHNF